MLQAKIEQDYYLAKKNKEQEKINTLRLLIASIYNKEIEKRAKNAKLEDKDILDIIRKEVKKRKEAIFLFKKGKREDLATKEEKELEILVSYLPKELEGEKIKEIINKKIKEMPVVQMSDFGKIMKEVMKELKGQAEGKKVADMVREAIEKSEKK